MGHEGNSHERAIIQEMADISGEEEAAQTQTLTHTGANPSQQGAMGLKRLSYKFISHIPEAL